MEPEYNHISILMPNGTRCRAYIPFDIYPGDSTVISLEYSHFVEMALQVAKYQKQRQVLTDLPHSPERTQMKP